MSLRNPENKMSKSDVSHMTRINMTDSNDDIIRKIKKAVTDSEGVETGLTYDDEKRKGLANLIRIYSVIKGDKDNLQDYGPEHVVKDFKGETTEYFKNECGELIASHIGPIRDENFRLRKENKNINQLLKKNSKQAQEIAEVTINRAKKAFGLP